MGGRRSLTEELRDIACHQMLFGCSNEGRLARQGM